MSQIERAETANRRLKMRAYVKTYSARSRRMVRDRTAQNRKTKKLTLKIFWGPKEENW